MLIIFAADCTRRFYAKCKKDAQSAANYLKNGHNCATFIAWGEMFRLY